MSREFALVDTFAIKIREGRHRPFNPKEYPKVRDTIKLRGPIQPIVVTRDLELVVGLHRLTAHRELAKTDSYFKQIPAQFSDALNEDELRAIQIEENLKRIGLDWQEETTGIAELVEINRRLYGWTQTQTAEDRDYDKSTVSNKLKVAAEIKAGNPEVLAAGSFREAERIIARQEQTKEAHATDLLRDLLADDPAQILTEDFCEWAPAYRGRRFDVLHVDFPWGAGAHKFGQGSGLVHGTYADSPDETARLNRALFDYLDRILADQGHLIYWFWMPDYHEVRTMLEQRFRVDPIPLIWAKTNGGIPRDPKYDAHNVQEAAFLCGRGGRILQKASFNVFHHQVVSDGIHQNEKPVAVLKHFLGMVVREGDTVLDPTCGSGSSIRAAWELKAYRALGVEINPDFASRARLKLDKVLKATPRDLAS
jgi:ParB-like chromosome segregation protein Spo0J